MGKQQHNAAQLLYLQHVAHECLGVRTSGCVYDKGDHCGKGGGKSFSDDCSRCRPCEDFNLSWGVDNDVFQRWISLFLAECDDLGTPAAICQVDS